MAAGPVGYLGFAEVDICKPCLLTCRSQLTWGLKTAGACVISSGKCSDPAGRALQAHTRTTAHRSTALGTVEAGLQVLRNGQETKACQGLARTAGLEPYREPCPRPQVTHRDEETGLSGRVQGRPV